MWSSVYGHVGGNNKVITKCVISRNGIVRTISEQQTETLSSVLSNCLISRSDHLYWYLVPPTIRFDSKGAPGSTALRLQRRFFVSPASCVFSFLCAAALIPGPR